MIRSIFCILTLLLHFHCVLAAGDADDGPFGDVQVGRGNGRPVAPAPPRSRGQQQQPNNGFGRSPSKDMSLSNSDGPPGSNMGNNVEYKPPGAVPPSNFNPKQYNNNKRRPEANGMGPSPPTNPSGAVEAFQPAPSQPMEPAPQPPMQPPPMQPQPMQPEQPPPARPQPQPQPMGPTGGMQACPACTSCTNEGQESQFQTGFYVCQNGKYAPVACAASDGSRVEIGSTYTKPNFYFYMECQRVGPNGIHLVPVACKNEDKMVKPGETFVKNFFWYSCFHKTPGTLAYEAMGCVNEVTGEQIQANSTYKTNDFSYRCYKTPDGGIYAEPMGCVLDGKEYPVNADVDSQSKSCWYRCFKLPDGLQLRVMGCLEGGQKYEVGESIIFRDYVYRCVRNMTDESVTREPIGCVEKGPDGSPVTHLFGERWQEGTANPKYVFECKGDSKRIFKSAVQCVFEGPEGQGKLDGGCMRRFGNIVLQCYRGENAVHGTLYPGAPPEFEEQAKATGLRVC